MNTEQLRAELLPCPFCGSVDIEVQTSTPDREGTPTHLMCADCGAAGPWSYERGGSYTVAAALWNARAALQSQDREDAERYRWLRGTLHGAKAGGGVEVNDALQVYETPKPGEEVRVYWYQDTPVGFYQEHGTTLDEAIDHARRTEGDVE